MKKNLLVITILLFSLLVFSACKSDSNLKNIDNIDNHNSESNNPTYKIVIDPGHGGKDVGAEGVSGKHEKNFTLSVSKKVKTLLEQEPQIQVFMTRTEDSFISQQSRYRPKFANQLDADLFISIHGNTFSNPSVSGTETYYYNQNSLLLAKTLQEHVVEETGFRDRGVKKNELFVVKETEMPAALIEVGYLTNPQEEAIMWNEEFQNRVAASIVDGIKEYLEKSEKQGIVKWLM